MFYANNISAKNRQEKIKIFRLGQKSIFVY